MASTNTNGNGTAAGRVLSQSAYARHRGCTRQAVAKAIRDRRLERAVVHVEGRPAPMIDVELADEEWGSRTDPTQVREEHRRPAEDPGQAKLFDTGEAERPAPIPRDETPPPNGTSNREAYNDARARREGVAAELAEIELAKARGETVSRQVVEREWFKLARLVRDAVLAVPDNVSRRVAALEDPRACRAAITAALEDALRNLADSTGMDG